MCNFEPFAPPGREKSVRTRPAIPKWIRQGRDFSNTIHGHNKIRSIGFYRRHRECGLGAVLGKTNLPRPRSESLLLRGYENIERKLPMVNKIGKPYVVSVKQPTSKDGHDDVNGTTGRRLKAWGRYGCRVKVREKLGNSLDGASPSSPEMPPSALKTKDRTRLNKQPMS